MKIIHILIFILLLSIGKSTCVFSQSPHSTSFRIPTVIPHLEAVIELPTDISYLKKELPNRNIPNPSVRYSIQNLKTYRVKNKEVDKAIQTLLEYAENDTLKDIANYLQRYLEKNGERAKAIEVLDQNFTQDTANYFKEIDLSPATDIRRLSSYIQHDSTYLWLTKIGRDSLLLNVYDIADNHISFWLNNGKNYYQRFWIKTLDGDSIGSWLHITPDSNKVIISVDDNVVQLKQTQTKTLREEIINNNLDTKDYTLKDMMLGELKKRFWTYYSIVELTLGQGYQSNWAGGGENSLSSLLNTRTNINYNKDKISWENYVNYRLGFLKSGNNDMRKNEDRFELNSKFGHKALKFEHWYYASQFNIQTQLLNSYEYPNDDEKVLIGNFMTPIYFNLSLGIDYKPSDKFSLYISPIAGKWTYLRDTSGIDPTRYGVDMGKKLKRDAGARVELKNKLDPFDFMHIENEFILFSSYHDSKQDIFIDWKLQVNFKINYYMRAVVYTYALLDKNYSKDIQFKETLNLGVHFRF